MPKVLIVLPEGFEEIEAITPIDLLRRAGAEVVIASLSENTRVTGRSNISVVADTTLDEAQGKTYDLVIIPGGPGVKHLRADARVKALVQMQAESSHWVSAICAGPTVLLDAGLLEGRAYTSHPSVEAELPMREGNKRVVVDGNIVTSRGAGTALDFGLELVARLFDPAKAAEIAQAICV